MLSPQKNKSGQRSYRRRDVEIAVRIKQLLYNEMFTIAGARKKLQSDQRDGSKTKVASNAAPQPASYGTDSAPTLFDTGFDNLQAAPEVLAKPDTDQSYSNDQREALKTLAGHLLELREMLNSTKTA